MKLLIMIFAAIFGFFSWILSPFLPAQPERTEFLVDGVYQRFPGSDGEEKTVAKLMELAQAGDVDRVYEAFAPQVRDEAVEEDLRAQIQALLDFLSQQVTSRQEADHTSHFRQDNISSRTIDVALYTDAGTYTCLIRDRYDAYGADRRAGFRHISIYPQALGEEYGAWRMDEPGVSLVYLAGEAGLSPDGTDPMESLTALAQAGDTEGLYALFSPSAQAGAADLEAGISELAEFLAGSTGWTPYTWTQYTEYTYNSERLAQERFYFVDTALGTYRCDIRCTAEDTGYPAETGLYSITVFPAPDPDTDYFTQEMPYRDYAERGRTTPGIFWEPPLSS